MTKQMDNLTYKCPRTMEEAFEGFSNLDIPVEDWTLYEVVAASVCVVSMVFICFVIIVWG